MSARKVHYANEFFTEKGPAVFRTLCKRDPMKDSLDFTRTTENMTCKKCKRALHRARRGF